MAKYANVIVDISLEKLDKTFQYRIPETLEQEIREGVQVDIPFGHRSLTGYVIELTEEPEVDPARIKEVQGIHAGSVPVEAQLIALAAWIRRNYGGTMNQALKTVIPVRRKTREVLHRSLCLTMEKKEAHDQLARYESRHATARARLLRELLEQGELDYTLVTGKLGIAPAVIRSMEEQGILEIRQERAYRNPVAHLPEGGRQLTLNPQQQQVVDFISGNLERGRQETYLLRGVTGSGKTEVYMELISRLIAQGKQAIVLIPEIALTYQTVMRFYNRFGDRVSIMNSRLSQGERCDQFERARLGEIDIMIGPRSALFTPFARLGMIIIDEEHETSYKSESVPRYHAREVAIQRARQCGASVLLGSATPSVDSYYQARLGNYQLLELTSRVSNQPLPECQIIDMREELREGNRSILSTRLQELMEERLEKGQQTMLFLNRRGVAGIMSCRACGYVVKCPHCDVAMSRHNNGRMVCHYCGHQEAVPTRCPSCGSAYISGFKAGTQKVEELVKQRFPQARVLRMDFDTTRSRDSYEKILQTFAGGEADVLIGTQMIVKGHDFPNVTLVGILAADMSLHVSDFHGAERTFQLLTQAVGRAGRGKLPGQAIIQTYTPEHFAIQCAKEQDYEAFYQQEAAYRSLMAYPPVWNMLVILCSSEDEEALERGCRLLAQRLQGLIARREEKICSAADTDRVPMNRRLQMMGPAEATIARINDIYRRVIYLRTCDYELLVACKDRMEKYTRENPDFRKLTIQYDFNPMSGF